MFKPDYDRSIVNLTAAVSEALGGGPTGYPPVAELPPERLRGRSVIQLLVDGLGETLLRQYPDTHLAQGRAATLSSVFPSTTASAVTSYSTAVAPQQHAITGWHMWLKELGSVATILPFVPRHGGPSYTAAGWQPADFIGAPPLADRLSVPKIELTPRYLVDSAYNLALAGTAQRIGYEGMAEFFEQLAASGRRTPPAYVFAYWSELDGIAHHYGANSREVHEHFLAFDRAFGELLTALNGSGTLLLASADHGLIDTHSAHTLHLADHPALAATLALPLCGEPRAAYCYVRAGRENEFQRYISQELGHACEAVAAGDLIADGWFGRGPAHPRLSERVGDYVLLLKDDYVLRDRLANEKPFQQTGVHGGASATEMEVPLIVFDL